MKIIDKDKIILSKLRKNSREKLKNISNEEDMPIPTVFDRIKKLEGNKVILKWCCAIDPYYVRFPLFSIFVVKSKVPPCVENVFVNNIFEISTKSEGGLYIIEAFFQNNFQLKEFSRQIKRKCKLLKKIEVYKVILKEGISEF